MATDDDHPTPGDPGDDDPTPVYPRRLLDVPPPTVTGIFRVPPPKPPWDRVLLVLILIAIAAGIVFTLTFATGCGCTTAEVIRRRAEADTYLQAYRACASPEATPATPLRVDTALRSDAQPAALLGSLTEIGSAEGVEDTTCAVEAWVRTQPYATQAAVQFLHRVWLYHKQPLATWPPAPEPELRLHPPGRSTPTPPHTRARAREKPSERPSNGERER